jgi:hypothetical protein
LTALILLPKVEAFRYGERLDSENLHRPLKLLVLPDRLKDGSVFSMTKMFGLQSRTAKHVTGHQLI